MEPHRGTESRNAELPIEARYWIECHLGCTTKSLALSPRDLDFRLIVPLNQLVQWHKWIRSKHTAQHLKELPLIELESL